MEPSAKKDHEDARRQLLEEGTRSYLEAVTALLAYQQEVQSICREVMKGNLVDYADALRLDALKVELTPDEIRDVASPSFTENWKGDRWYLGVRVQKANSIPDVRWWSTHCYLEFESDQKRLYCWVGEWYPNKKMANSLHGVLQKFDRNVLCDGNTVWIERPLKVEDVPNLSEHLEGLSRRWIELWRETGGFQSIFKTNESELTG